MLVLAFSQPGWAAQVNWGSDRFAVNQTSSGAGVPLDSGFTFELGAFAPGFAPTRENRSQWLDHWHSAQSRNYNAHFRFFAGSVVVEEIDTENIFVPSNRAYIWGYDAREGEAHEWILISDSSWRWPAGAGIQTPAFWTVGNATEAIVGEINAPDGAFHMRTEALTDAQEPQTAEQWRAEHFADSLENPEVSGWGADPDADHMSNLLEYALGRSPTASDAVGPRLDVVDGHRVLTVDRTTLRSDIAYLIEVSSDLRHWENGADQLEIIEDSEAWLVARDPMPLGDAPRRFVRLRIELR